MSALEGPKAALYAVSYKCRILAKDIIRKYD